MQHAEAALNTFLHHTTSPEQSLGPLTNCYNLVQGRQRAQLQQLAGLRMTGSMVNSCDVKISRDISTSKHYESTCWLYTARIGTKRPYLDLFFKNKAAPKITIFVTAKTESRGRTSEMVVASLTCLVYSNFIYLAFLAVSNGTNSTWKIEGQLYDGKPKGWGVLELFEKRGLGILLLSLLDIVARLTNVDYDDFPILLHCEWDVIQFYGKNGYYPMDMKVGNTAIMEMEHQLYGEARRYMLGKCVSYSPMMTSPGEDLSKDMMNVDCPQAVISPVGEGEESPSPAFRYISTGLRVAVDFPKHPLNGDTIHRGVVDAIWWDGSGSQTLYHVLFDDGDESDYDNNQIQGNWDLFKDYSGMCTEAHLFVAAIHLIERKGDKTSAVFCHDSNGNQGGGGGDEDEDEGMQMESVVGKDGCGQDEEMLVKCVGDPRSVQVGRRVAMVDEEDNTVIHHGCIFKISKDQAGQMIYAVKFDTTGDVEAEEFSIQEIEGKCDHLESPQELVWLILFDFYRFYSRHGLL
jgi:hypothetical protein